MSAARSARPPGRPTVGIDAQSPAGRMLQALRAGEHSAEMLVARFGGYSNIVTPLIRKGLVERRGGDKHVVFRITDAGRAACPLRNPLAAGQAPAPAGAAGGRIRSTSPREIVTAPGLLAGDRDPSRLPSHLPVHSAIAQETAAMPIKPLTITHASPIAAARDALARAIAGTAPDEAIDKETLLDRARRLGDGIEHGTLANSLKKMVAEGLSIAARGATTARRYFDPTAMGWEPEAPADAPPKGTSSGAPPKGTSSGAPEVPAHPAGQPGAPEGSSRPVEFSVYSDGRLAIIDGDDILVLQPEDTRRLAYFLGCFNAQASAPQLLAA